jgi:hypothetical protein
MLKLMGNVKSTSLHRECICHLKYCMKTVMSNFMDCRQVRQCNHHTREIENSLVLRLDVGIHVVELNWSRNTKSEGNGIDLQYQCCCLDAGVIEFWAIPRWGAWYWRGGGAGVVEYQGNWDGFPVPNSVSIQTLKFGFTNSNSKIWASIPASKRSIGDL